MSTLKGNKLNRLQSLLPEGLLADASWLHGRGYSSDLLRRYRKSGWLEQPARGVYRRPGGKLLWQQVVISLQNLLRVPVIPGGRTALELHGFSHYVAAQELREVHLYGESPLPGWVGKLGCDEKFVFHNANRLFRDRPIARDLAGVAWRPEARTFTVNAPTQDGLTRIHWGQWEWPITLSSPERAVLELLAEVPERETFHQADMLIEGLLTLSPRRLQTLLEDCRSIKVKRLFLWFAERHQFGWRHRLEEGRIDLGRGKRMLLPGGRLDSKYRITVPKDLDAFQ